MPIDMTYLYILSSLSLTVSAILSKEKTLKSLKIAWNMFLKILPLLLLTLTIVSIALFFLPDDVIANYLNGNGIVIGSLIATMIGSVSLLPGFITFPLCGLLLKQGVSFTVLAAFTTSLMMVGIVTYPIEAKYFGRKLTIIRNVAAFIMALIVSFAIGAIYGEVF